MSGASFDPSSAQALLLQARNANDDFYLQDEATSSRRRQQQNDYDFQWPNSYDEQQILPSVSKSSVAEQEIPADLVFSGTSASRTHQLTSSGSLLPSNIPRPHVPRPAWRHWNSDETAGLVSRFCDINSMSTASFNVVSTNTSLCSADTHTAAASSSYSRIMDSDSLLHNSCKLYPETIAIVESALQLDPDAIRRKIPLLCKTNDGSSPITTARPDELYNYPINIALKCNANLEIIKLLVAAGPDVLVEPDGPNGGGSLSIALMQNARGEVIQTLLTGNKACASVPDKNNNLPLHLVVRTSQLQQQQHQQQQQNTSMLGMVAAIHEAYPEALLIRNFNGETPLCVAARSIGCPEQIVDLLQKLSFGFMEAKALHLDNEDDRGDHGEDVEDFIFLKNMRILK